MAAAFPPYGPAMAKTGLPNSHVEREAAHAIGMGEVQCPIEAARKQGTGAGQARTPSIKLTWLVLGEDPAARSRRVEQFTAL